jgi:hypothetical protein
LGAHVIKYNRRVNTERWRATTVLILAGVLLILTGCGIASRFDEDHAIGCMIAIRKAQDTFKFQRGHYGTFDELAASNFSIPSRVQYGYQFTIRPTQETYVAVAVPTRWKERSLSLYLDQSGIIRGMFKNGAEANANDGTLNGYGINPSPTP